MVLCMSDDRTHEDLPTVWRGRTPDSLSELAHGLFAVTTASGVKSSKARWSVEDNSEVLLVLKALAEVSSNNASSGGTSERSLTASSSMASFASGYASSSGRAPTAM
jgi:hypothetical protein